MNLYQSFLASPASPFHAHALDLQAIEGAKNVAAARRLGTLVADRGHIESVSWSVEVERDAGDNWTFPNDIYLKLASGMTVYLPELNVFGSDDEDDPRSICIGNEAIDERVDGKAEELDCDTRTAAAVILSEALGIPADKVPGYLWLLNVHVWNVYRDQSELNLTTTQSG